MAFSPADDSAVKTRPAQAAFASERKAQARLRTLVRRATKEDRAREGVRALCVLWNTLQAAGHHLGVHPLKQLSRRNGEGELDWQFRHGPHG